MKKQRVDTYPTSHIDGGIDFVIRRYELPVLRELRGFIIVGSRFVGDLPRPVMFDATGVLFKNCLFKNCIPTFDWDTAPFGAVNCEFS